MTVYRIDGKKAERVDTLSQAEGGRLFVVCHAGEVPDMLDVFSWDEDAILQCTDIDESVRHTDYGGYDFTSLIYAETVNGAVAQQEINMFFAQSYLVLVLPDTVSPRLQRLANELIASVTHAAARPHSPAYLHYLVFDNLMADFSETLEALEDEVEALAEMLIADPRRSQLEDIGRLRKTAYTYKKLLRALSYLGGQILLDENKLLAGDQTRYFRDVSARLMKQYDFAESIYILSNDLLHIYDSKFSAQMNETMGKLTVITLFFAPLTFIVGVYGMNFAFMPELQWPLGYPAVLGFMVVVCVFIFAMMKKNKWL
ncbi:MAG: magnesium transporter CorA family protein [Oscillospiraceae bacterium]|jgi:magnesium transporter|nr:magnesium transporter CorA family protein [Oscillospiraceae bacterium]